MMVYHKKIFSGQKVFNLSYLTEQRDANFEPGVKQKQVHLMVACNISINCLFGALGGREASQYFAAGIMSRGTEDPAYQILN